MPGSNCNKKITKWVGLKVRLDVQDRLIPQNDDQAGPIYTEPMANEKTNLGQAGQAFLPSQTLYDNSIYEHRIK